MQEPLEPSARKHVRVYDHSGRKWVTIEDLNKDSFKARFIDTSKLVLWLTIIAAVWVVVVWAGWQLL